MNGPKIEVLSTIALSEAQRMQLMEAAPGINISTFQVRRPDEIPNEIWTRTEVLYTDRIIPSPDPGAESKMDPVSFFRN